MALGAPHSALGETNLLKHPTLDQLHALGLHGMAKAFAEIAAGGEADISVVLEEGRNGRSGDHPSSPSMTLLRFAERDEPLLTFIPQHQSHTPETLH